MAIIYPFPPYRGYTWNAPVVPKLYWDVYSQEQRIKALCMEYAKLIAYNSDLADTLNNYIEIVNTMQQQLPELVNEDVKQEIAELVTTGQFAEMVKDAIEQLTTDVQNQLDALNRAIQDEGTNRLNADNALQAQIDKIVADRKGTYVTYEDFGAKLDGVTDDSAAIVACHEYANANGVPVVQHRGNVVCNYTVDVKTSCDFSGMEFTVADDTPSSVYNIVPDESATIQYSGQMTKSTTAAPVTDLNATFSVATLNNDTWKLGTRATTETVLYHLQPVAFDKQGVLVSSNFFADNEGLFQFVNAHDLYERSVEFKGASITASYGNADKTNFQSFVLSTRNNTVIRDISVSVANLPVASVSNIAGDGLIHILQCANNIIDNVNAQNNSQSPAEYYSYIVVCEQSYNVKVTNSMLNGGWGCVGCNYIDTMTFDNCITNRVDCHYGVFGNLNVTDTVFTGLCTVSLGYGDANCNIDNCKFRATNKDTASYIYSRREFPDDTNVNFQGTVNVNSCTFKDPEGDSGENVFAMNTTDTIGSVFPNNKCTVHINNVKYDGSRNVFRSATTYTNYYYVNDYIGSFNRYGLVKCWFANCIFNGGKSSLEQAGNEYHFVNCEINTDIATANGVYDFTGCTINSNVGMNQGAASKLLKVTACNVGAVTFAGPHNVMIANNVASGFTPSTNRDRQFKANVGLADYPTA